MCIQINFNNLILKAKSLILEKLGPQKQIDLLEYKKIKNNYTLIFILNKTKKVKIILKGSDLK